VSGGKRSTPGDSPPGRGVQRPGTRGGHRACGPLRSGGSDHGSGSILGRGGRRGGWEQAPGMSSEGISDCKYDSPPSLNPARSGHRTGSTRARRTPGWGRREWTDATPVSWGLARDNRWSWGCREEAASAQSPHLGWGVRLVDACGARMGVRSAQRGRGKTRSALAVGVGGLLGFGPNNRPNSGRHAT
jgi:hypothetical protein